MRKRNLCVAVLCGMLTVSLAACVPDVEKEEVTSTEGTRNGLFQDKNDTVEGVRADLEQLAEDYAPVVRTLEDGTQVQLTPDHPNSQVYQWMSPNSYNTYFVDADNRGCSSCHQEGLGKLVDEELSWRHVPVMNGLGTEIDAKDCRMCHNEYSYDVYGAFMFGTERSFGQMIHGIHRNDGFTGDCMSCHAATADGNGMRLWEDAKYDILGGINSVENVQGDFSYEQDVAVGDSLALANWGGDHGGAME